MNIWMRDTNGKESASLTMAFVTWLVTMLWYALSIFTKVGHFDIRAFDAQAASFFLTPILALYFGRRMTDDKAAAAAVIANNAAIAANPVGVVVEAVQEGMAARRSAPGISPNYPPQYPPLQGSSPSLPPGR